MWISVGHTEEKQKGKGGRGGRGVQSPVCVVEKEATSDLHPKQARQRILCNATTSYSQRNLRKQATYRRTTSHESRRTTHDALPKLVSQHTVT